MNALHLVSGKFPQAWPLKQFRCRSDGRWPFLVLFTTSRQRVGDRVPDAVRPSAKFARPASSHIATSSHNWSPESARRQRTAPYKSDQQRLPRSPKNAIVHKLTSGSMPHCKSQASALKELSAFESSSVAFLE